MTRGRGDTVTQRLKKLIFLTLPPRLRVAASVLVLSACVPVPPGMLPDHPGATPQDTMFPDIEPIGTTVNSLHFKIRGYNENEMQSVAGSAEDIFSKIGTETGLYSFLAGQQFAIVLYKDSSEYSTKTKQPDGSRAVTSGDTVYTYPGPDLTPALAHFMMHMVFNTYMKDKISTHQWLNEGLALHMEVLKMPDYERAIFQTTQSNQLRSERIAFSQFTYLNGTDEQKRKTDTWYLQTESVVAFLLKQGSSLGFAAFLGELRNGATLDQALSNNYGAKFRNMKDLENAWQVAS